MVGQTFLSAFFPGACMRGQTLLCTPLEAVFESMHTIPEAPLATPRRGTLATAQGNALGPIVARNTSPERAPYLCAPI